MFIFFAPSEDELASKDEKIERALSQIATGDTDAMGTLYELVSTDVYAYALSKCQNREWAEDLMHDTFVQIYKNARQYHSYGKPLAWIFTIELNLFRRMRVTESRVGQLDDEIELAAEDSDFSERVVNQQFIIELFSILEEDEREIISLHIVSGLKHREIATLMKKPLSTVLSRYNRALKKLQLKVTEEAM